MSDADDIDDIREQKRKELRERVKQQQDQSGQQQSGSGGIDQDEAVLKKWLTDDARKRLNTVEMAHPERAKAIKRQIAALAKQGRLNDRLDEEKIKEILKQADDSESKSFDIKRR